MNGLPARNPDRMRKPTTAARSSAAWVPVTPCRHSSVQSAMPAESTPTGMDEFYRIKRLPPYVFAIVNDLKNKARTKGEDIIDLGMGNPDMPTPKPIVAKLVEAAQNSRNHRYSASRGITRLRIAITRWY